MITPANEKMRSHLPANQCRNVEKNHSVCPKDFPLSERREYVCRSTKGKNTPLPPRYLGFKSLIWYHTQVEWANVFFNLFVVSFAFVYSFKSLIVNKLHEVKISLIRDSYGVKCLYIHFTEYLPALHRSFFLCNQDDRCIHIPWLWQYRCRFDKDYSHNYHLLEQKSCWLWCPTHVNNQTVN